MHQITTEVMTMTGRYQPRSEQKRGKTIALRVSIEDKEALEQIAEVRGLTVSRLLLGSALSPRMRRSVERARLELEAAGTVHEQGATNCAADVTASGTDVSPETAVREQKTATEEDAGGARRASRVASSEGTLGVQRSASTGVAERLPDEHLSDDGSGGEHAPRGAADDVSEEQDAAAEGAIDERGPASERGDEGVPALVAKRARRPKQPVPGQGELWGGGGA